MRFLALLSLIASLAIAQQRVPVPKSSGPMPMTPDANAFGAAPKNMEPLDLAKAGYTEEEFLLSGSANVYDWAADGAVTVKTPNAPYTDRIMVRRPLAPNKFSGTVIVEIPNTARRFDWTMMWSYAHDYFMEHGDAYVLIGMPASMASMKQFNSARYGSISMANPTPGAACPGAGKNGPADFEEGLRWDIFSQVAAAMKSGVKGQPMAGFKVERIFMTTQGGDIVTYINAIHDIAKLENGKPAYDGYLVRNPPAPVKISQCAPNIPAGDPRRMIKNVNVPVVSVAAQGEVIGGIWSRKADSDEAAGKYRLYEIAGAAHIDHYAYRSFPAWEEQKAATGQAQGTPEWPFDQKCTPEIPLSHHTLLMYAFDGAFANLDAWVRKGTAPPKAPRLEIKEMGTPQAAIALDQYGNGIGGVRNAWVDVPVQTFLTTVPGPGTCRELGKMVTFEPARISALYPSAKDYNSKVTQSVDKSVKERFFTETDGKKIKAELAKEFSALAK